MSELRLLLQHSMRNLLPELSTSAQAQLDVPIGLVQSRRQTFEDRISAHQYQPGAVYIGRATRTVNELIRNNLTYAQRLRLAEHATLFELPSHLIDFLRDHDNLHRAAVRSRLLAKKAATSPRMDVLERVTHRLDNIQNVYHLNFIEQSCSRAEQLRMGCDPLFVDEFSECTVLLQDEVVRQLNRFEQLVSNVGKDMELENVGPDHNVDDYGHEVVSTPVVNTFEPRDHSKRCCICLDPYTLSHTAFHITTCGHIIGKSCLAQWLNGTTRNANLCPHCRTPLCERRARRPVAITPATSTEQNMVNHRLSCCIAKILEVEKLKYELSGHGTADYITDAMDDLNFRLFEDDVGFCLSQDREQVGWGFVRARWH